MFLSPIVFSVGNLIPHSGIPRNFGRHVEEFRVPEFGVPEFRSSEFEFRSSEFEGRGPPPPPRVERSPIFLWHAWILFFSIVEYQYILVYQWFMSVARDEVYAVTNSIRSIFPIKSNKNEYTLV